MSLLKQLTEDMKTAMRSKDKARLGTLRLLISDLKNLKIEKQRELDDQEEVAFLATQAKRRRESIEAYEKAERADLVAVEAGELEVITEYLPKQLSEAEVRALVQAAVAETGATSRKDFGRVMQAIMPQVKGRFPGKDLKPIVEAVLG